MVVVWQARLYRYFALAEAVMILTILCIYERHTRALDGMGDGCHGANTQCPNFGARRCVFCKSQQECAGRPAP